MYRLKRAAGRGVMVSDAACHSECTNFEFLAVDWLCWFRISAVYQFPTSHGKHLYIVA